MATTSEPIPATGAALLAEQVRAVRLHRETAATFKAQVEAKGKAFAEEHAQLFVDKKAADDRVVQAEAALKALTVSHYDTTKEKKPTAGVEVKIKTGLDYKPDDALAWAKEQKLCLVPESLDVAAFESVAGVMKLPFVKVTETPQAQIAKDLAKALA